MSSRVELLFTLPHKLKVDEIRRRQHVELGAQPLKSRPKKRLHENIRRLIAARDEGHLQTFSGDLLVNKMKINFDVFGSSIEYGVDYEISGTAIIAT